MNTWVPLNDNHAIDNLVVAIKFPSPIPSLLFKKTLALVQTAAFDNGLRSRHSLAPMQMVEITGGQASTVTQVPQGQMFNSVAPATDEQPVPNQVIEQIICANNTISYRTWQYVSWEWQIKRMELLLLPVLELLSDTMSFGSIRVEYLDKFRFQGDIMLSKTDLLLNSKSKWLPSHIFERTGQWHCHTGCFLPTPASDRRLLQIFIDSVDQPISVATDPTPARWMNIITAREDFWTEEDAVSSASIFKSTIEQMHLELKTALGEILADAFVKKIYLWDTPQ